MTLGALPDLVIRDARPTKYMRYTNPKKTPNPTPKVKQPSRPRIKQTLHPQTTPSTYFILHPRKTLILSPSPENQTKRHKQKPSTPSSYPAPSVTPSPPQKRSGGLLLEASLQPEPIDTHIQRPFPNPPSKRSINQKSVREEFPLPLPCSSPYSIPFLSSEVVECVQCGQSRAEQSSVLGSRYMLVWE